MPDWPAGGATQGTRLMAGKGWDWTGTVQYTPDPSVPTVDVAVRADPAARGALTTLVGYLARPQGPVS